MQNKTVKLFTLGALAAATTLGAHAENTYDYFVGFDAGTQLNGKVKVENNFGFSNSIDTDPSAIVGLSGGAIINDHHRVKLGLAYNGLDYGEIDKSGYHHVVNRTDLTASYDYMLPIANKLNWTVGGHMGYEFFESESDHDVMDGFIYGVQTGLDYRLTKNWSLGAEVAYTAHHKEEQTYENGIDASFQLQDDVTVIANVQYHF
ncbi:outer membrane beta-barrel protein [Vibrio sp. OCN044]|uniref:Outer membrane beta-barrel protein n=1 Tax=Vibrio tetraodonis subsp. pristinus TaxID=2695891 RepID=A0A6L8LQA7_9VIBR|nr:outer membrane beta-barrel protein [Vibrio tetraodonis]MYM57985.1 outer membrane beta-barrel protein [Vibrio tetraodonis subsp. pristinus]